MRSKPLRVAVLLTVVMLWMRIPQVAAAQEVTPTPAAAIPVLTLTPPVEGIEAPGDAQVLRGSVEIRGTAFSAWSLAFGYKDDPTGTWFPLAQSDQPVIAALLFTWDTSGLSDGSYILRLRIFSNSGTQDFTREVSVGGDEVAISATPTVKSSATPQPSAGITATAHVVLETETPKAVFETVTPLPALPDNQAVLRPQDIYLNFAKGALGVLVVFGFAGLALWLRRR